MRHWGDFFNKLDLVNFSGGAMGTFFINLLIANDSDQFTENAKRYGDLIGIEDLTLEWSYFPDYLYALRYHTVKPVQTKDSKEDSIIHFTGKFGDDYFLPYAYAFSNYFIKNAKFNNEIEDRVDFYKLECDFKSLGPDALDLAFEVVEPSPEFFSVIKSHVNYEQINHKTIPYANRITCYFRKDKDWIKHILLLYKRSLYALDKPNQLEILVTQSCSSASIEQFQNRINGSLEGLRPYITESRLRMITQQEIETSRKNDIMIDIYKIIFEDNLEDLYNIYPDFALDREKTKVLRLAQETSHKILDDLKLDHTMSDTRELIPTTETSNILTPLVMQRINDTRDYFQKLVRKYGTLEQRYGKRIF